MSMRRMIDVTGALAALWVSGALAQQDATSASPNLGIAATPEQIAGWDISIPPSGAGLPPGSGTAAQGAPIYAAKCIACHGEGGQGGLNDRLVGGQGSLDTAAAIKTVGSFWPYATTVFDFIRRAMPYQQPHSLTDDEAYALTAYILHLNEIIAEDEVMDAETLPRVRMPNRDGFVRVEAEARP
jgi:mono/diheme cytochrome c family protein